MGRGERLRLAQRDAGTRRIERNLDPAQPHFRVARARGQVKRHQGVGLRRVKGVVAQQQQGCRRQPGVGTQGLRGFGERSGAIAGAVLQRADHDPRRRQLGVGLQNVTREFDGGFRRRDSSQQRGQFEHRVATQRRRRQRQPPRHRAARVGVAAQRDQQLRGPVLRLRRRGLRRTPGVDRVERLLRRAGAQRDRRGALVELGGVHVARSLQQLPVGHARITGARGHFAGEHRVEPARKLVGVVALGQRRAGRGDLRRGRIRGRDLGRSPSRAGQDDCGRCGKYGEAHRRFLSVRRF
ncbi:hypothetical protein GALL_417840 [mine drainage metagenome]|uniref:Uncharacterized protein n=1 Tax=mine drainage metagenome TaxID=410659 RepID=A0A1J5PZN4_9ZZZZ